MMLAAPFLFKKGLKRKQVVCFMLVFAGILMVSAPGILGQTQIDSFGLLCGFGSAIAKLSVASVSILGYLEPLSAVIFSFLLLHETFTSSSET